MATVNLSVPTATPAGMITGVGTASTALLLDVIVMEAPPAGAGPLNVTVSVTDAGAVSVAGLSVIDLTVGNVIGVIATGAEELELL